MLYYLGVVQYIILKFAWIMNKLMDASPTESMNVVASIFLGQAEAPLLVKPFLADMTASELFSVMLSGFATVSLLETSETTFFIYCYISIF
jgi:nucleoside permease NupC